MTARPPYVLGLDPALRRTGVATITHADGACSAQSWVIATPAAGGTLTDRLASIRSVTHQLGRLIAALGHPPALALLEGASYGSEHGQPHERGGLYWALVGALVDHNVPVAECPPPTLKKWATGSGRAEKAAVVAAMGLMWPGVRATGDPARHHECEALALAHMAAQHLGWPVPIRTHHGASLAVIKWPVG